MPNTFFYSGISFPPRREGKSGFFAVATDEQLIKESIYVILNTRKGEMPMSPSFGTSVDENLFDAVDQAMQGIICQQIQQVIETWEPRVIFNSISAFSQDNTRLFNVMLTVKSTGVQFSTDVPFNP